MHQRLIKKELTKDLSKQNFFVLSNVCIKFDS